MFIKIYDGKEDFCNEVITNMSLQYMIHSVSFVSDFFKYLLGSQNNVPIRPILIPILFYGTGSSTGYETGYKYGRSRFEPGLITHIMQQPKMAFFGSNVGSIYFFEKILS